MPTNKTDKKKATQLDRIENAQKLINKRIDYYGNAIKFLEAWVPTLQGQLDELRGPVEKPTAEEIESSAYGEREGLEEGDCCKVTPELLEQLRPLELPSYHNRALSSDSDCELLQWSQGKLYRTTWADGVGQNIGATQFLRLAKLTAEKLRSAREEEEAKKKLEPWTKVMYEGKEHHVLFQHKSSRQGTLDLWCPGNRTVLWGVPRSGITLLNP